MDPPTPALPPHEAVARAGEHTAVLAKEEGLGASPPAPGAPLLPPAAPLNIPRPHSCLTHFPGRGLAGDPPRQVWV